MRKTLLKTMIGLAFACSSTSVIAATGGPDSYGYTWIDSNEPDGPIYNWIEIATPAGGSGTLRTGVACDDCHEAGVPLGFNFPFYGTQFNQVSIASNGVVYFENVYLGLSNSCIPGTPSYTMTQYNFIAHMWDDLAPNYQGGIYTQQFPSFFVIEFYDIVPCCATGDGDTWQVILFSNGNILMQYKELSNQGLQSDFTVGIQNNPTTGLQYKCDAAGIPLASNRAILFSPPTFDCGNVAQNILGNPGFCPGGSVVLDAGNTAVAQQWSTGPVTPTITVNTTGTYSIYVLDTNGCTLRDTATVVQFTPPTVSLGADITQCDSAVLDAGVAGMQYSWSEGSTTQTVLINLSGSYSIELTDPGTGCSDMDTINVTITASPAISLGNDSTQCGGPVLLDPGAAGATFLWSDGSTTQTIAVSSSGTYSVEATAANGCSASDTIMVTINPVPAVALGNDTAQCAGNVVLDAGNAGANYLWSDGTTTQTLSVSASGIYFVAVTDTNGCTGNDTAAVTINALPVPALGSDTTQCGGTVMLDAGNTGSAFLWSDSSATQMITVSASGLYSVQVTDTATGCMGTDTVSVTINAVPVVDLGADTSVCGASILLDAGNAGLNYLWSDSSAAQTITVTNSGIYYVTVSDPNTGCAGTDTINATIHALPTVTFSLPTTTVCVDDASVTLSGGAPAGGAYSGTSVTGGVFDPSAGAGTYVITYTYTDGNGCSDTATQNMIVDACVGISESSAAGVQMYPNPSNGILNIGSASSENTVVVFNALGETVMSQQMNTTRMSIDLGALDNGIYLVQVTNSAGTHIERVILRK